MRSAWPPGGGRAATCAGWSGALVLLAPWPYTLLVIKPVNDKLKAADPIGAGAQTRALIERWGWLHAGRTALGVLATAIFFCAAMAR